MAYCTTADIQARFPDKTIIELTDDEKLADEYSTLAAAIALNASIQTRITAAIADADGYIDSYLRKLYAVPLSAPVPQIILSLSVDLTICRLFTRKNAEFEMSESITERCKKAKEMLEEIKDGDLDLGVDPPVAESSRAVAQEFGWDHDYTFDDFDSY